MSYISFFFTRQTGEGLQTISDKYCHSLKHFQLHGGAHVWFRHSFWFFSSIKNRCCIRVCKVTNRSLVDHHRISYTYELNNTLVHPLKMRISLVSVKMLQQRWHTRSLFKFQVLLFFQLFFRVMCVCIVYIVIKRQWKPCLLPELYYFSSTVRETQHSCIFITMIVIFFLSDCWPDLPIFLHTS